MSPEYVIAHGVVHKNGQPMNLESVVADLNEHYEIGEAIMAATRLTGLLEKVALLAKDPAEEINPDYERRNKHLAEHAAHNKIIQEVLQKVKDGVMPVKEAQDELIVQEVVYAAIHDEIGYDSDPPKQSDSLEQKVVEAKAFIDRCDIVDAPESYNPKCDQCDAQGVCCYLHGDKGEGCVAYPQVYKKREQS